MSAAPKRPRVAMLVIGFPTPDAPATGIFNLRAAKLLSTVADITVIFMRTWLPKRRSAVISEYAGVRVVTLAVPQLPRTGTLNIALYEKLGWPLVRRLLHSCDLIHSVAADFCGVVGSRWAARVRVPHVAQVIGSDIDLLRERCHTRTLAGWENEVDVAVCNSAALARKFSVLFPHCNVRVVYRGTDLSVFHPLVPPAGPAVSERGVRFLFLGGFDDYRSLEHGANTKGGRTLIAAWQRAEDALYASGASLVLAGRASQSAPIVQWRARLRYPERVHLAGTIDPAQTPGFIGASDVVLVPSLQEGLPNVAVEASGCGRAVFGSNVDGLPEVIADGETGLLLPAGDTEAWRAALVAAASDSAMLTRMGRNARSRMEKLFDAANYPQQMMRIYASLLPRSAVRYDAHEVAQRGSVA